MNVMRFKKYGFAAIVLILLAAIIYWLYKRPSSHPIQQSEATPVVLIKAKQIVLPKSISATGTLIALHQASISPKVSGYIASLNFTEGAMVKKGQVLLTLDADNSRDQLAADHADMQLAKLTLARNQKLVSHGDVSPATMDQLKANYQKDLATYNAQKTVVADNVITAPFSGIIGNSTLNVGDYVQAGSTLVTLTDTHQLKVSYALPASVINAVKQGQAVTISSKHHKAQAKVSFISPSISSDTQTFTVHATLKNSAEIFHPGEYVSIQQNLGKQQTAIVIPQQSIIYSISGANAYSVIHGHVVEIPISLGPNVGNNVVVTKGLKVGTPVISAGVNQVRPGSLVKVTP